MNLLPRMLGLALLLVLVALAAVLFGASTRRPHHAAGSTASDASPPQHARVIAASHRLAFPLALTAVVVCTGLLASLALRSSRTPDSDPPLSAARNEIHTLARLAENTVAQSRELAHERDVRQRAEADALETQRLLNRTLEEKIRLGRDLHDGLIQSLYAAGLTLEAAKSIARTDPAELERRLDRCRESLNRSIREVRAYIAGLAPDDLTATDFSAAIGAAFAELRGDARIELDLRVDESAVAPLAAAQRAEILQLVREAISNSVRHGQPSHLSIRFHPGDNALCLLVQDNGRGFSPALVDAHGHGLRNMQARAAQLGAHLRIESQPGAGTRVIFTLPLTA